jgi:hypothetical protein
VADREVQLIPRVNTAPLYVHHREGNRNG